jgi:FlaA1/EpsC-like NDP-sugar epimerase
MNGYRSSSSWMIVLIDGFLILGGILMGTYLRFWGNIWEILEIENIGLKIMLILFVVQMAFYYFDLYDAKIFRAGKEMGVLLLGSLGVSSLFLGFLYYLVPLFEIGRGIFIISLPLIYLFTFSWRLFYAWVSKARMFREKILIIGTGELAKKIKKEILENGNGSFEIVGFIDESREKLGKGI